MQKGLGIIFLLLFLQKSGVELYLHSRLHTRNYQAISSSNGKHINSIGCVCVDDFLMPFAQADASFTFIEVPCHQKHALRCTELTPVRFQLFNSLRAPPIRSV